MCLTLAHEKNNVDEETHALLYSEFLYAAINAAAAGAENHLLPSNRDF